MLFCELAYGVVEYGAPENSQLVATVQRKEWLSHTCEHVIHSSQMLLVLDFSH